MKVEMCELLIRVGDKIGIGELISPDRCNVAPVGQKTSKVSPSE